MLLTKNPSQVSFYLFNRGLVDYGEPLIVTEKSKRNYNLIVECSEKQFLLKQLKHNDFENIQFFKNEFEAYKTIKSCTNFQQFRNSVPNVYFYDPTNNITCFEYIEDTVELNEIFKLKNKVIFEETGRIINLLHNINTSGIGFYPYKPWILDNDKNFNILKKTKQFDKEYLQMVSSDDFLEELEKCKMIWNNDSIIHSDLKLENILFQKKTKKIYIIDWEFAGIGDKVWDIALLCSDMIIKFILNKKNTILGNHDFDAYNILYHENKLNVLLKSIINTTLHLYENKLKIIRFIGLAILQKVVEISRKNHLHQKGSEIINLAEKMMKKPIQFEKLVN